MGLIKNALAPLKDPAKSVGKSASQSLMGGIFGVVDQGMYKEYITSGNMAGDILMKRGEKVNTSGRNTKSDANIITNGSVIDVQANQCMIIVENGKVVEACMEAGQYTYDNTVAPSFFEGEGKFGEKIKNVAKEMWEQAKMGGQRHSTQRVYFINMGILDKSVNWGVGNVPFKHTQYFVTNAAPYTLGVRVKGNGIARVRIENPIAFYESYGAKYAGGDNNAVITMDTLDTFFDSAKASMIKAITSAITALGSHQEMMHEDITLPENMDKIAESVNKQMADTDVVRMGFVFYQFTPKEFGVRDEDLKQIQNTQQRSYDIGNINLANYNVQMGKVEAMKKFGENSNVTDMGGGGMMMMGDVFSGGMGNIQAQPPQQFPQQQFHQQQAPVAHAGAWVCSCGATVAGNFCTNCGNKKPEPKPVDGWKCACGATATGKFCPECGQAKPVVEGWTCSCGAINQGKFCQECGEKKPANAPLYKCDNCGWQPEDPKNPPKFCPECGDRFDESDAQ